MNEFKGTNETWFRSGTEIVSMPSQTKICKVYGRDYDEAKYNAVLISNCREMLEKIKELYNDLRQGALPNEKELKDLEEFIKNLTTL